MNQVDRFKQLRQYDNAQQPIIVSGDKSLGDENLSTLQNQSNQLMQLRMKAIDRARNNTGAEYGQYNAPVSSDSMGTTGNQGSILPQNAKITQQFGQKSQYDVFSGGRNYGVDFAIKAGTPLALPPGQWQVVEAQGGDTGKGFIGNKSNRGYGNSILAVNTETGEQLRFSHLNGVNVQPGKVYGGGTVIGASGATGNVTGAHLDLEYKNAQGRLSDILKSPYARYLFGS